MGEIVIERLTKSFGPTHVIPELSLSVGHGEFCVFVGPSGCGKSTLLRLIAGLEAATSGTIRIDGRDVTALPPYDRGLSMVFQSYALYPHMSVRENIAFALRTAKRPEAEIREKVAEASRMLQLDPYLDRRPAALPAPNGGLNKQQVEAATGFRLGNGSVLTSTVEVENPAYARLMERVRQGEMELRGISAGGMAMSRDARARYDASLKALEAQRQQLANTSRTINVQRQQRAPVAVPVQSSGGHSSSGGQSFQGTHTGHSYNVGQQYTMGKDTYTANASGGFVNDRTGRAQGKGSTYYDPDSNTFKVR